MLPETEKLLQTWLKIQIWQFRIFIFKWIFVLILFIIGILGFFGFVLPELRIQLQKLDRMQRQILNLTETTEEGSSFLDQLKEGTGQEQQIFDAFLK